jgi:hypothetical protein
MEKRGFSSHRWVMKLIRMGTGRYLCKVYNYHDSRVYGYKLSGILPRIDGLGMVFVWLWFWLSCVKLCDL